MQQQNFSSRCFNSFYAEESHPGIWDSPWRECRVFVQTAKYILELLPEIPRPFESASVYKNECFHAWFENKRHLVFQRSLPTYGLFCACCREKSEMSCHSSIVLHPVPVWMLPLEMVVCSSVTYMRMLSTHCLLYVLLHICSCA